MQFQNQVKTISIQEDEEILRLDLLLSKRFKDFSRTYFQDLIAEDKVLLNGKPIKKRIRPKMGDHIEILFKNRPIMEVTPQQIPLDIVYEDPYLIAVNKPAGMVAHPAPGNWTDTFANALLAHCKTLSETDDKLRPGIVHRLDKDTSGLIIAAKTTETHLKLVDLFASRKIHKEYLALCIGHVKKSIINVPIGRHPIDRKKMAITYDRGKEAITEVYPLTSNGKFTKVRLYPKTGRTHQIRVHMQFNQTPLLGDNTYGNVSINKKYQINRHLLHAEKLHLYHPITHKLLELTAPVPPDIEEAFLCAF